ncbi:MAG: class I SAM-dependent methyltransferase [Coriobacteriia bacterium]
MRRTREGTSVAEKRRSDHVAASKERFGPRAAGYRESPVHAAGRDLDLLLEWVAPRPGEQALDVATGGGHVAVALARAGARVTALDVTPEMLAETAAFAKSEGVPIATVEAEAAALPFPDGSFDIVTCRIAAHHFPDAARFFTEVARVLAPGGRLGFQDQTLPPQGTSAVLVDAFERLRDPSHNQAYSEAGWRTLIERAGLVVERAEVVDKPHGFAEWTARQDCEPATVAELRRLMAEAPPGMAEWLAPECDAEGTLVSFRHRHLVVLARA